ncbi:MAG TPA: GAF and ANTAR domain-containing protein [Actinotalea caeni]|uniref:GAF and ANTAR domain-containing protein n=1 Tax=Actinotalea caeni TaxID=1348467 RepID=UPI002B4AC34A|nr:GAF and ANTAR domain-containing protein [Actinotalea caeni]HLV54746.1 GAF and ANTAR domain-containing protein [Actinotalea caeni]
MTDGLDIQLAQAAREMDAAEGSEELLDVAVGWSMAVVPGCQMAGVTMRRRRGRLESVSPSDPVVVACDLLQYELEEGPCLDAITDDTVIAAGDVARDPRWPRWGPQVAKDHGIAGMLSVRLFSSETVHGALNLYSREPGAFDTYAIDIAVLLATHVSVALGSALSDENLRLAVDSRHLIGQAQGILMERFSLDAAAAFAVLSRVSQDRNIRLVAVAEHVVRRRELPGAPVQV